MRAIKLSIFLLFILALQTFAQSPPWISLINNPASNYHEVIQSYQQWKDSMIREGKGTLVSRIFAKEKLEKIAELKEEAEEHFNHWLYSSRDDYDDLGNPIPLHLPNQNSITRHSTSDGNTISQIQGSWKARGPFDSRASFSGITGAGKGIGRVFPFALSPVDTNIIFTGGSGVGVWRSFDDGLHWQSLSPPITGASLRDIKAHPANAAIWYMLCKGNLYKTTDTGSTWSTIYTSASTTGSILVDASQPSTVYLGLNGLGFYKSLDEGASWQFMNSRIPIGIKPGNASVLYAFNGNTFLRSTDSGLNFDSVTTITHLGSLYYLAVTPADTNCIYISCQSSSNGGVVVSLDGGNTFVQQPISTNTNTYFVKPMIAVSPLNKDVLMMGGEMLSRSIDGGLTWEFACTYSYDSTSVLPFVHPDHRCVQFSSTGSFWDGNDGGIYKSEDAGVTYIDRTRGLDVSQFVSLDCSPQDTSVFLSGALDNSILIHTDTSWKNTFAGDGFDVAINPDNPDNFYGKNQYGYYRTHDGGQSYDLNDYFIGLNENTYSMSTGFPIRFNPQNSNSLYIGVKNVWKSTNNGDSVHTISGFPGTNGGVGGFLFVGQTDTMTLFTRIYRTHDEGATWIPVSKPVYAVDPDEINKVWSVQNISNRYTIYNSMDTGNTWQVIQSPDVTFNSSTINIECVNNASDGIFLSIGGMIYYIDNTLSNWQPFNNGFPGAPVYAIKSMKDFNIVRVASYGRGVWESDLFQYGQLLVSDFIQDKDTICPGDSIQFFDNSLNAGPGYSTLYQWSFPGGSPSQSSLPFPKVLYSSPGTYDVSLHMTGSNGTDSITKFATVVVNLPPQVQAPLLEDFEGSIFPPSGWNWNHYSSSASFARTSLYGGGYGTSTNSVMYGTWVGSPRQNDNLITPEIDLSFVPDPVLTFDVLYAYDYIPAEADTFKLFYSYDCGITRHYFFERGGLDLKTDSVYSNYSVIFDSTSWSSDTISLYSIASHAPFQIGFEMTSIGRCEFFLDNIQILSLPGSELSENSPSEINLNVYPNPFTREFTVLWNSSQIETAQCSLYSMTGQLLMKRTIQSNKPVVISATDFSEGIYFLQVQTKQGNFNRKVVK